MPTAVPLVRIIKKRDRVKYDAFRRIRLRVYTPENKTFYDQATNADGEGDNSSASEKARVVGHKAFSQ